MAEEFANYGMKVAILQILDAYEFGHVQESCLDVLCNIAALYIENIGRKAHARSEHASRVEATVYDLYSILEDFDGSCGGELLSQYLVNSDEIPFLYEVPSFPVKQKKDISSSSSSSSTEVFEDNENKENKEKSKGKEEEKEKDEEVAVGYRPPHVESFLPCYPDERTYKKTAVLRAPEEDSVSVHRIKGKLGRHMENSFIQLKKTLRESQYNEAAKDSNNEMDVDVDVDNINTGNKVITAKADNVDTMKIKLNLGRANTSTSTSTNTNTKRKVVLAPVTPISVPNPLFSKSKTLSLGTSATTSSVFNSNDQVRRSLALDETELQKKKMKCEAILDISHEIGEPDSLNYGDRKNEDI